MTSGRIAFWGLLVVTVAVYVAMVAWSLPFIAADAGGLIPFDMQPTGYGFDAALAFVGGLSPEGVAFYLDVQHSLDLIYPALLAATLFFAIAELARNRTGRWRWLLAAAAIPGAIFDWLENSAVATMLAAGPDGLTPEMVETASRWTILKSGFTTLAMAIVVVLIAGHAVRWIRGRKARS
ncbi:MAG: hypothetical protein GY798_14955 [Hyphomicrobiales bacterium]|nr:hypothetical protein [Hyphomicrobiales bacterium]